MRAFLLYGMLLLLFTACAGSATDISDLPKSVTPADTMSAPKERELELYTQAIKGYLDAAYQNDKDVFDTLFVGPFEELQDVSLPSRVGNTEIVLIKEEKEAEKLLKHRRSFEFVNMVVAVDALEKPTLTFIRFHVLREEKINWWPIHNCNIELHYNKTSKGFEVLGYRFDFAYNNKYTKEG